MENKQITIQDLATIKQMLDVACTRGAFRGAEMSQVGDIFDRLSSFLKPYQTPATEQNSTGEASPEPQGETNA